MRNGRAPAGFRPNGWPFGLQSRSRLGTFEPAKNLESGEVLALGNPCETAEPLQDSGPMGGRLVCRADLVWAPLNPLKTWRVERYWRWATHAKRQSPCRIQAQWVAVWADLVWAPLNPLKAWRVERYWRWATHAKQQSPTAGFQPNGWPFGLQRRSRLGTFEPAKNLESGEVLALGNPCETAEPLQDSGPMGGCLVCRADLVWAPLNPLKAWRVERSWRWATHAQQDSGPMGGRLVCRADLVWAPLNPLKTWRVERYWRWATHAKRQSPCRIQAQWVAVWSAEPISFGHL